MGRYRIKREQPRSSDWWDGHPMLPQVSVSDACDVDTGLVDLSGNTIWRTPNPVGFGRDEEWG